MLAVPGETRHTRLTEGARFCEEVCILLVVLVIMAFQAGLLTSAQAEAVGRLTQVEGKVDRLRGGQLPAVPVKFNDSVQTGDVI